MLKNALDYIRQFRERLHHVNALAKESLGDSQTVMKRHCDCSAVLRYFHEAEEVLLLLPIPSSALSTKYSDPQVSDTDYVTSTPERIRKTDILR